MQTVTYENVEIVVRRATVRDNLHAETITQRAMQIEPDGALGYWATFGDLCSQVVSSKGLPFNPLTLHELDATAVHAAYEQYMLLPKRLVKLWKAAVEQEDAPAAPELAPDPNAPAAGSSK